MVSNGACFGPGFLTLLEGGGPFIWSRAFERVLTLLGGGGGFRMVHVFG